MKNSWNTDFATYGYFKMGFDVFKIESLDPKFYSLEVDDSI